MNLSCFLTFGLVSLSALSISGLVQTEAKANEWQTIFEKPQEVVITDGWQTISEKPQEVNTANEWQVSSEEAQEAVPDKFSQNEDPSLWAVPDKFSQNEDPGL
ncbi:hypothetical protein [Streptococcus equi]|uniref:hypothetical protein n=1 Tax=Streptococcus equi TaxID=1336 RepID=UPI001BB4FD87|nr:hypothetical protein [Streptococcus equi]QTZ28956.1 hypothetical protein GDAKBCAL_00435 [Streptococcus equi subsp. zooepidemicus]